MSKTSGAPGTPSAGGPTVAAAAPPTSQPQPPPPPPSVALQPSTSYWDGFLPLPDNFSITFQLLYWGLPFIITPEQRRFLLAKDCEKLLSNFPR